MAINQGLVALLRTQPSVMSLIADKGRGIAVGTIDQNVALPFISITTLNTDPMGALDGTYGMRSVSVDIDCVAISKDVSDSLADRVEEVICDYVGPAGKHRIRAVNLSDRSDDEVLEGKGSQRIRYVTTVAIDIQFE